MTDPAYRVDTMSNKARWRIDDLASYSCCNSDPFKIGKWNWRIEWNRSQTFSVSLCCLDSTGDGPSTVSFVICLTHFFGRRMIEASGGFWRKQLKRDKKFVCTFNYMVTGKFIIDVEFRRGVKFNGDVQFHRGVKFHGDVEFRGDVKTASPNSTTGNPSYSPNSTTGNPSYAPNSTSIWVEGRIPKRTDLVVVRTCNGSIAVQRAVLAARSPVFRGMFSHDTKEKRECIIIMPDEHVETFRAFIHWLDGNLGLGNTCFVTHRLGLLRLADKYLVLDLKEACEESLVEDIDTENVFDMLQYANLYRLSRLKICCINFLLELGKVNAIEEKLSKFMQSADRELIGEVFKQVVVRKGF